LLNIYNVYLALISLFPQTDIQSYFSVFFGVLLLDWPSVLIFVLVIFLLIVWIDKFGLFKDRIDESLDFKFNREKEKEKEKEKQSD